MSVIKSNLPINENEDAKWDEGEAIKAVKAWASNDDGEIDFKKYRKAFFFGDDDNDGDDSGGEKQGDYKLPFASVFDGELKAVWHGVSAAMEAVCGARGGVDLGDDNDEKESLYKQICSYYKKFDKQPPEFKKELGEDTTDTQESQEAEQTQEDQHEQETEQKADKAIVKREVGERVDILCTMDTTTVKDLGEGVFEATITTSEIDRHQESIATEGISTENWQKNPVVLYGHDYQGLPIGKGLNLKTFKNKMTARFQLAVKEYPFADTVAKLIKGGYLNAVSIGGVVRQWSDDFSQILKMDLAEFSIVPVPANPSALITSRSLSLKSLTGKESAEIAKEYAQFVEETTAEKLKNLNNNELNSTIDVLEKLLAVLKATADNTQATGSEKEVVRLTLRKTAAEITKSGENIIKLVKRKEI